MNAISFNSRLIAEVQTSGLHLHRAASGVVLKSSVNAVFHFSSDDDIEWWPQQARVSVGLTQSKVRPLGWALPERTLFARSAPKAGGNYSFLLELYLTDAALNHVERTRAGGDLLFLIELHGVAQGSTGRQATQTELVSGCPQSEWIKQLRNIGWLRALLIEVAFPQLPKGWEQIDADLIRARESLSACRYDETVALCRKVIERLDKIAACKNAAGTFFKASPAGRHEREAMTLTQRMGAIGDAIRRATHPAHHVDEHIVGEYGPAEAEALLGLTIQLVSFIARRNLALRGAGEKA